MKKAFKIIITAALAGLLAIPAYAQSKYAVNSSEGTAITYNINGLATGLPTYMRVDNTARNFILTVKRPGRKDSKIHVEQRVDGLFINNNSVGYKITKVGIAIDFTSGVPYMLPAELTSEIIDTMSPKDRLDIVKITVDELGEHDIELLLVDAAALRSQRVSQYFMLTDPNNGRTDIPKQAPELHPSISASPEIRTGVIIPGKPVITAAANGQLDQLKRLLDSGANLNEIESESGDNALLKTLATGDERTADHLVGLGINLKHTNRYGQNALHISSSQGLFDISRKLMAGGIDVNSKDNGGNTPLMYASGSPNTRLAELLITRGGKVDDKNNSGITPLSIAASNGNTSTVDMLMSKGAQCGSDELVEAIKGNNELIVAKLLEDKSLDLDRSDGDGNTPLHSAIYAGNDKVITELINAGANINATNNDGITPLMTAINMKNGNAVDKILTRKPDLYAVDNKGRSAYSMAAVANIPTINRSMAQALKSDNEVAMELFEQVAADNMDEVKRLIENGARVNVSDIETGNTPLFTAVANNYKPMMQLLIAQGANVNWQNKRGTSPLILSVSTGDDKAVEILLKAGANPNFQNTSGDTALVWALKLNRTDIVRQLLVAGANPNVKNYTGITPMMVVEGENNTEAEKLLKSFGAY